MAACEDYHSRIKGLLLELARMLQEKISFRYKIFVDSGLLMEKEWCVKTGLAFWGKNCLAVSPLKGSFFNIGLMVVDFEIAFKADGAFGVEAHADIANQAQAVVAGQAQDDMANKSQTQADLDKKTQTPAQNPAPRLSGGCGECRLCVDACPSKAIDSSGYVLDHAKCVSYLTQKQALENSEQALLKGWLHGCDVCQAVCPYNKQEGAWTAKPAVVSLEWAISLDEARYKEVFGNTSAGWKPLELLKRNAQTAKERQERQERRFASE
jgi:epoxyqueuosine reductase